MNDELRARLVDHLDPDHECTPQRGGCQMPHYRYNLTAPAWIEGWPEYSPARAKAEEAREARAAGSRDTSTRR